MSRRPPASALPTISSDSPARVDVGGVDEVDPGVEGGVDDPDRLVVIRLSPGAEHHRAEAQLADLNAGAAEGAELHPAQLTEGGAPGNRRARRNSSRLAAGYSLIVRRGRAIASVFVLVVALGIAPAARAHDDGGRWILTGASSVPVTYWQGITSNPAESNFFLVGIFRGLWKTTPKLGQTAGVNDAIPPSVAQTEGYNHIGDPTWNPGDGGRVILPMECYDPSSGRTPVARARSASPTPPRSPSATT